MNVKTIALAIGVAGVLLVAGLATMFAGNSFGDLFGQQGGSDRSGNDDQAKDTITTDGSNKTASGDSSQPGPNIVVPDPEPDPASVQGEPKLNVAYVTGTYGNEVYYGMPYARSGPYPGYDMQYPGANEFTIETNGYGPDQPEDPVEIALFIQIDGIGPRWVGSTEHPEGTVEVRTYPPNAMTPRLVNLFADNQGNCKGILVNAWDVFDHSFIYEHGVTDSNKLTFCMDITRLGDYTVKVWAIHDHDGGEAVQVSNMVSWTVHVTGSNICSNSMDPSYYTYANGFPLNIGLSMTRSTEPDDDNRNLMNTVAYTGTVRNVLRIEGTSGYSVSIGGEVQTGTAVNGWREYNLGTVDLGGASGQDYTVTITFSDGQHHSVEFNSYDVDTAEIVGRSGGWFYPPDS